jgi:SAM-dependent methyltransferase
MPETSGFNGFGYFLYKFAAQYAPNAKVLDIGCGIGKGAALLSKHTQQKVLGVDHSKKALKSAMRNKGDNLSFSLLDINDLSKMNEKFGLVTMFSTLEHLTAEEQNKALSGIGNVLEDKGVAVISTNNKLFTKSPNPFHKKELSADEFKSLIGEFFTAEFFGIHQKIGPEFKIDGLKNKSVNLIFRPVFMQEVVQPLIPRAIKDFVNIQFLRLHPPVESDFKIVEDLNNNLHFLAVCRKKD